MLQAATHDRLLTILSAASIGICLLVGCRPQVSNHANDLQCYPKEASCEPPRIDADSKMEAWDSAPSVPAGILSPRGYHWAGAGSWQESDGAGALLEIHRPVVGRGDHSLGEVWLQSGALADRDVIEIGWMVSPERYGDPDPHLFVFHWVNGAPTCFDACGWTQVSSVLGPGMNLSGYIGRRAYLGFVRRSGQWWAWFDGQWLGFFDEEIWGRRFRTATFTQWFGEVFSRDWPTGTEMGNGFAASEPGSASFPKICQVDSSHWTCRPPRKVDLIATDPGVFGVHTASGGTLRFGGAHHP